MIQILAGVAPGEQVVTSGQFLLDAESRMREAIQKHLHDRLLADAGGAHPAAAERLPWSPQADAVYAAYLEMARTLGIAGPSAPPLDVGRMADAARALVDATPSDQQARNVLAATSALEGRSLVEQRQRFAALGEAVLAMAEVRPPSRAVADRLYVMSCPMQGGRWLQTTDEVANPYGATDMQQCGEVQRTIDAVEGQ
jgi:hypothetical protein